MKLSLYAWGETLDELSSVAREAESAGFTRVWTAELARSATIAAAAMASATTRIGVATGIALAFVRSPMVTALEALDLDELANGRFTLGLGTGVQRLNEDWHAVRFGSPVAHLREVIDVIRLVMRNGPTGAPIAYEGAETRAAVRGWQRPFPSVRPVVPIYVAAVGPAMCRLAGRTADGWIAHELGSAAYFKANVAPLIDDGLAAARRSRGDIALVASACCVIDRDAAQARRWAAGLVAFYATVRTYRDFFAWHGFAAETAAVGAAFKAGDVSSMVDAVPDAMVDALTFAGTADDVRARIHAYDGLVDEIKLSAPTHHVPAEVTRATQRAIIEELS